MRGVDVVWMLWMCLGMSHCQRGVCVGASVVQDVSGAFVSPDVSSASLSLLRPRGGSDHTISPPRTGFGFARIPVPADDAPLPSRGAENDSAASMPPKVLARQMKNIVCPDVRMPGSLGYVLGSVIAVATCSLKPWKQALLNERLWKAAAMGQAEVCAELIDLGADVNSQSVDGGDDPRMHFAELYGLGCYEEKELREAAKEAGITADRRKTKKPSTTPPKRAQAARTALRWAAYNGHAETVRELLNARCELDAEDNEGFTALHEAALYGHLQVAKLLLAHGAAINARTHENWTPLHLASAYGYMHLVKLLQESGADLCATTNGGLTAMDWAKAYGFSQTSEFLSNCASSPSEHEGSQERTNFFIQGGIASQVSSF